MSYSLTVTHIDEEAVVRVLQIGRQGVSGAVDPAAVVSAPLAEAGTLQFLLGWNGTALVRVEADVLQAFLGISAANDNDDYAAWVAAF